MSGEKCRKDRPTPGEARAWLYDNGGALLVLVLLDLILATLSVKEPAERFHVDGDTAAAEQCCRGSHSLASILPYQQSVHMRWGSCRVYKSGGHWRNVFHVQQKCMQCGQLIVRKISKIGATKCQILQLKCTKFDFRWRSAPDPFGAYSVPRPTAVFKGLLLRGGRGWRGRGGKEKKE